MYSIPIVLLNDIQKLLKNKFNFYYKFIIYNKFL
uniref:Uncharacterized protein n=1 Tax=viral metagenome TaxID=1070528 RepID=A0A6C0J3X9_9ZZZZ